VRLNMNYEVPLEKMALLEAKPTQGDFGMTGARLIAPGDPFRSVLFYRVCKLGRGRMPYLGSSVVDERGGALLHDWIRQLPPAADGTENAGPIWAQRQTEERLVTRLAAAAPLGQAELETIIGQALSSVSSALRLLWALDSNRLVPARRLAVVARAASHPNPLVRDLFERFVPEDQRVQTLGVEIKPERILGLQGSPDRGRDLFFRETGPQCYTCHRIGQQGRDFGPDLSHIGQKYSREQVLENILLPSKTIEPKFVGFLVETKDGSSHSGLVMQKTKTELVLKEVGGHVITIPAADISRLQQLQLSLMPEQLLQSLTAQQAADLIDFLSALK
jgi:putative heme-binding domain-containing protein